MMIPAPRVAEPTVLKCREDGCEGTYEPYRDGSLSCYCGSRSNLTVDDVEILNMTIVYERSDC